MNRLCKCGHGPSDHNGTIGTCFEMVCLCTHFIDAPTQKETKIAETEAQAEMLRYVAQYKSTKEKMQHLLLREPPLREMTNAEFEDWYRQHIDPKTNPDTIRRTKQKLVAEDPALYGPSDIDKIRHKHIKAAATRQWLQT